MSLLRQAVEANPVLGTAPAEVKSVQSRRFAGTYADLLAGGPYAPRLGSSSTSCTATRTTTQRDAQFSRIARAIEKLFPAQVVDTAVALAELHAVTEELDQAMALAWLGAGGRTAVAGAALRPAWREVGRRPDRENQLSVVMAMGRGNGAAHPHAGLRMMLKMMRGPAVGRRAWGRCSGSWRAASTPSPRWRSSQGGASGFLRTIQARESALIARCCSRPIVSRARPSWPASLGQARWRPAGAPDNRRQGDIEWKSTGSRATPTDVPHDVDPEQYRSLTQLLEESFKKNAVAPVFGLHGALDDLRPAR